MIPLWPDPPQRGIHDICVYTHIYIYICIIIIMNIMLYYIISGLIPLNEAFMIMVWETKSQDQVLSPIRGEVLSEIMDFLNVQVVRWDHDCDQDRDCVVFVCCCLLFCVVFCLILILLVLRLVLIL